LNEKAVGWIFYSERVIMVDLRAASFDNPPCDFFFLRHGFQPIHGKPALDQSGIENADSLTATGGASNCNWVVCPVHQATASRNNGWFNAKLWRNPYEPASNAFFRCATNPQRQSVYTAAATGSPNPGSQNPWPIQIHKCLDFEALLMSEPGR
jgi:hypothetical protein